MGAFSLTRSLGLALVFALAVLPMTVFAEKEKTPKRSWSRSSDKDKDKGGWRYEYTISPRTAKRLVEAREFLLSDRLDAAEKTLGKLNIKRMNPLERAQIYRVYAFIAYGRGDLTNAREQLEQTHATGALSPEEAADLRYQIAQLWMQDENWSEAAKNFELWFEQVETPNATAYYTLALTYYQLEQLDKALAPISKAVGMTNKPREGWLQLLLALRLTRKEYPESVPILEALVRSYPKKHYWLSLSTVHGALGNYDEALVQLQLAYTNGLLTEDAELRRLARLSLFLDLPYRAARVLEVGLDEETIVQDTEVWELLSNSWIAAREYDRAVRPLEQGAALASDGELYVRLAQVHIQREQWEDAANALEMALEKGELESPGDAKLLMGIAFYSQKQPGRARTWFSRASQYDDSRQEAQAWLEHLDMAALKS